MTYKIEDILKGIKDENIMAVDDEIQCDLITLAEKLETRVDAEITSEEIFEMGNEAGLYEEELEAIISYLDNL